MGRIYVIGGANVDICGASLAPLRSRDSNPGIIDISFGGVGRNIAQTAALLGGRVSLVTCFSTDGYGTLMKQDCRELGMDVSLSTDVEDLPSSMYIALLDQDRDMSMAMSDMRILRRMPKEHLAKVLERMKEDDLVVIDANLDMECIDLIAHQAKCRIAADPVSAAKAVRFADVMNKIDIFKPNQYEASAVSGIRITDEASAKMSLQWFLQAGVKEIIISLAENGVLLGSAEGCRWFTHRQILIENATGGGDAFMGAYAVMRSEGKDERESTVFAIAAALNSIVKSKAARRGLSREETEQMIDQLEIREREL